VSTYGRYLVTKKSTLVSVHLVDQIWEISRSRLRRWSYALLDSEVNKTYVSFGEKHTSTDKLATVHRHLARK
jgi:hypothetical protein